METKNLSPFKSIGLCFSGGGFRASAFALGVLSYLNRAQFQSKPLLKNVEAISTVSGGTLTGVAYASSQANGFEFDQFYRTFYHFLNSDCLLETAIEYLEDDSIWKKNSKKRSLINAFALAYEHLLFKGKFDLFFKENTKSHIKHVCFNATEFSFGLAFRFQNTGWFGNKPINGSNLEELPEITAVKADIRLADAVASSSCFPFGFEPMIFPDDYFEDHTVGNYKAIKNHDIFINGIGIMDGGIVDNQGIGSMINIDESRNSKLDLIIINDVGSYKMDPWIQESGIPGKKKSLRDSVGGILNYLRPRWYYWGILLIGVSLLVLNSMNLLSSDVRIGLYILGGVLSGAGIVLIIIGILFRMLKNTVVSRFKFIYKEKVPEELMDDVASLSGLDISLIRRMISERMTTTFKMVNEIFLKQIRRLNYDLIYSKSSYLHRRITSTVYQLNGQETLYKSNPINKNIEPPTDAMNAVALIASETPTTLWWDKKDKSIDRLNTLVACGQFTTCYNLLDYIYKLPESSQNREISDLQKMLLDDWSNFLTDPQFLVTLQNELSGATTP